MTVDSMLSCFSIYNHIIVVVFQSATFYYLKFKVLGIEVVCISRFESLRTYELWARELLSRGGLLTSRHLVPSTRLRFCIARPGWC